jgi:hypothetical protein
VKLHSKYSARLGLFAKERRRARSGKKKIAVAAAVVTATAERAMRQFPAVHAPYALVLLYITHHYVAFLPSACPQGQADEM